MKQIEVRVQVHTRGELIAAILAAVGDVPTEIEWVRNTGTTKYRFNYHDDLARALTHERALRIARRVRALPSGSLQ